MVLGNIVDEQCSNCAPVVAPRDRPEVLLPRGIPHLEFDVLVLQGDGPRSELYSQCDFVVIVHLLLDELQNHARFADS